MNKIEVWKDIPDFENMYRVSNLGRVKSLQRFRKGNRNNSTVVNERILKQKIDKYGYCCISLSKNSKMKYFTVHRLVALMFVVNPNIEKFNQVNHKDGDKLNNGSDNLEWCDGFHNQQEAIRLGLRGGKSYRPRVDSCPINQFHKDGSLVKNYKNLAEAERISGIKKTAISNNLNGRSKSSGGFVFVYGEKEKPAKLS